MTSMEPRLANLVSLSATRMDFDLVRDRKARDEIAPRPESLEGFNFGLLGGLPDE